MQTPPITCWTATNLLSPSSNCADCYISNGNSFDWCTAMTPSELPKLCSTSVALPVLPGPVVQPNRYMGCNFLSRTSILHWNRIGLSLHRYYYHFMMGLAAIMFERLRSAFFLLNPAIQRAHASCYDGWFPPVPSSNNGLNCNGTETRAVICETHVRRGPSLSSELIISHL